MLGTPEDDTAARSTSPHSVNQYAYRCTFCEVW
jgi:hypothetical protein